MRSARVWKRLIGVDDRTVIEDVGFADNDETVVVHVRPRRPKKRRCGLMFYRRCMPFQVRDDGCAVIVREVGGQWGGPCTRPVTVRAVWRFDQPGPRRILLCDEHAAERARDQRLTLRPT